MELNNKNYIRVCKYIIALFILMILNSCLITTPRVENPAFMRASFNHSNFLNSCLSCHENKRPLVSTHLSAITSPGLLVAIKTNDHYGNNDCVECHLPFSVQNPTSWAFQHNPIPNRCNACHLDRKPVTIPNTNKLHEVTNNDCMYCHSIRTWLGFNHNPKPTSCNVCHDIGGKSPSRPMGNKSHNSKVLNHYVSLDCIYCHATPGVTYVNQWTIGASFNCMPCHQSKGQREHGSSISNCKNCHNALSKDW
jgi:hypothetical protein